LKPILKYPESFFINHIGLTVRYMFYDNCNSQFEFIVLIIDTFVFKLYNEIVKQFKFYNFSDF